MSSIIDLKNTTTDEGKRRCGNLANCVYLKNHINSVRCVLEGKGYIDTRSDNAGAKYCCLQECLLFSVPVNHPSEDLETAAGVRVLDNP